MPTSSQSRVLIRTDKLTVHPFLRQCSNSDATVMPIPRISFHIGVPIPTCSSCYGGRVFPCPRECVTATDSLVPSEQEQTGGWAPRTMMMPTLPALGQVVSQTQRRHSYPVTGSCQPSLPQEPRRPNKSKLPSFASGTCLGTDARRHIRQHDPALQQIRDHQNTINERTREDSGHDCTPNDQMSLLLGLVPDKCSPPPPARFLQQQPLGHPENADPDASTSSGRPPAVSLKKLYRQLVILGFNSSSFRGLVLDCQSDDDDEEVAGEYKERERKNKKERRHPSVSTSKGISHDKKSSADSPHVSLVRLSVTTGAKDKSAKNVKVGGEVNKAKPLLESSGSTPQDGKAAGHAARKAKFPTMRLRRILPFPQPDLLCFRCCQLGLTHLQVKEAIEKQSGGQVVRLQFEPEYMHIGDADALPRVLWIFQLSDPECGSLLTTQGLYLPNGERVHVRPRDDVYQEEHRAWSLVEQIKEEHRRRSLVRRCSRGQRRASRVETAVA